MSPLSLLYASSMLPLCSPYAFSMLLSLILYTSSAHPVSFRRSERKGNLHAVIVPRLVVSRCLRSASRRVCHVQRRLPAYNKLSRAVQLIISRFRLNDLSRRFPPQADARQLALAFTQNFGRCPALFSLDFKGQIHIEPVAKANFSGLYTS